MAAIAGMVIVLFSSAPAGASDTCTVSLDRSGADTLVATPSPECGPINVAAFSYASTAPGIWSEGAYAFDLTMPQSLASSASGTGVLTIPLPCGFYQVDAWRATGPAVPPAVTPGFLSDNYTAILGSFEAGVHGERACVAAARATASATPPAAVRRPFLATGDPPPVIAEIGASPAPQTRVASAGTTRSPAPVTATVLGSSSGTGGAGQLALSMVVAGVLVTIVFRSPLPSASAQRWTA